MRILDISPPISPRAIVWPGDHRFTLTPRWQIGDDASVNVSTVSASTHTGAHIDAPSHVRAGASDITATPLESCIGECLIVDVSDLVDRSTRPHRPAPAELIIERILETSAHDTGSEEGAHAPPPAGPGDHAIPARILLRHRTAPLEHWDSETPGIDPQFATWFGEQGGMLIGLDLLSFDPEVCPDVPAHQACVDADIVMLEGLDLSGASTGVAELIALPIPWQGADAAPVRAVLRYPLEPERPESRNVRRTTHPFSGPTERTPK